MFSKNLSITKSKFHTEYSQARGNSAAGINEDDIINSDNEDSPNTTIRRGGSPDKEVI